ncbi:hypothetical protein T459_06446 [Capsicum annuum]|uniref:Uncharacterized protein n=1 Tax=Capsicum annuum TaxID=4072 RepID=A0A2G3AAX9_CAPAN|nr:hypothetical protein T459_06446 [Capsicum annuum]
MGCTEEFTQASVISLNILRMPQTFTSLPVPMSINILGATNNLENLNTEMEDNELDDAKNEVNDNDPEDASKG